MITFAGWLNGQQQSIIDYLVAENRILKEQLGDQRIRFSDNQRKQLAVKAKILGRQLLNEMDTLVTPVLPENWIVLNFCSLIAIALTLQFSYSEDADHRLWETQSYSPFPQIRQLEIREDLCPMINVFCKYDKRSGHDSCKTARIAKTEYVNYCSFASFSSVLCAGETVILEYL